MTFVTIEEQLENIRRWNKDRDWGLGKAAFDRLSALPDPPPERFRLATRVLVPYLPPLKQQDSTHRTGRELARLMGVLYPDLREHCSAYARSHLLPHADEPEPGLHCETIDLGANLGQDPNACADRHLSPHAGILAAACHFPKWVELIDREELPGVWITGYADSYKIALFRNHDSRVSKSGVLELSGYCPGMGSTVGNRASRPLAVPRFR